MLTGWYYLHENGSLIFKNYPDAIADIRDSDLCLSAWPIDPEDRSCGWNLCVEALSLGVQKERVMELAEKWGINDTDAENYANYLGVNIGIDGNQKTATRGDFINLQESECGFGNTYLEAMADLCNRLGFVGGKMWQNTFKDLVKN